MSTPKRPVRRPVSAGSTTSKKPATTAPKPRRKIAGERPATASQPSSESRFKAFWARRSESPGRESVGGTVDGTGTGSRFSSVREAVNTGGAKVWIVALVLAVALGFFVVSAVRAGGIFFEARQDQAIADAQTEAETAAAEAAAGILSYDYTSVKDDLAASKKLMTPSYAKEVSDIDETLIAAAQQTQRSVKAQARNVASLPCGTGCSTDSVDVLVFADLMRTEKGKAIDPQGARSVFAMKKVDGSWLVDGVETR